MDNSEAWKRLNAMASAWAKGAEGSSGEGKLKLLGLDRGCGVVKGSASAPGLGEDLAGEVSSQSGSELVGRAVDGVGSVMKDVLKENRKIDTGDSQDKVRGVLCEGVSKGSADLPGFDREQMNILKALLSGVERDSLVHVQGLIESRGTEVGKGNTSGGLEGPAGTYGEKDFQLGVDPDQLSMVEVMQLGVERDSLIPEADSSKAHLKDKKSWTDIVEKGEISSGIAGGRLAEVKDSVKVAKERGLGVERKGGGCSVPAGSYLAPGSYNIPDGKGGERLVHFNARGVPYVDGDPSLGYPEQENEPRRMSQGVEKMEQGRVDRGIAGQKVEGKTSTTSSSNRSWASVASGNQKADIKMRYYPTSHKEVILPPKENVEKWSAALVGYFFDKRLNYNYVRNGAFYMWKNKGLKEVISTDNGFYIFMFESKDYSDSVFENGPYHMGGSWLVLKKWHRMMKLTKEQLDKVPVWVKLFNVPLEYWDDEGLSRIASAVGVPLFMDRLTAQTKKLAYARVCVEIEAMKVRPHKIPIRCGDDVLEVRVEYQWVPAMCPNCMTFGHGREKCEKDAGGEAVMPEGGKVVVVEEQEWEEVKRKGKTKIGEKVVISGQNEMGEEDSDTRRLEQRDGTGVQVSEIREASDKEPGQGEDSGSASVGGRKSDQEIGVVAEDVEEVNKVTSAADDDPIDPGEQRESTDDEVLVITPGVHTPGMHGTNQKGGGKNKNKRGGNNSGRGSQRGGKRK